MKIAVASEKDRVSQHFGHCQNFNIYEVDKDNIVNMESVPNPGHKPGYLPNFLNKLGVNIIISGGMGASAINLFNSKDIEVITGAQGNVDDIAGKYIKGELASTGSICHQHLHHEECGE
ncbi:NifB/NifX family molybdenum-iron cluster-binding protein [Clostridium sp. D2Q-11]|uniref:NifB/NifX family molybdenum-iron cluster-binding protein n=1 Tax=Anaeromonas frigoriresistens TaxID=2683708 RepID=A0A942UVG6_9FIRM|nr:NifB/NifX family molybdenum-iron cluster-binding protein [Anaeromonas frigoriresistens]MBS4538785.1 NifB/NifX family molybdenum-iron cluster-binding protein [Anaeromonas frigoriresistens]